MSFGVNKEYPSSNNHFLMPAVKLLHQKLGNCECVFNRTRCKCHSTNEPLHNTVCIISLEMFSY